MLVNDEILDPEKFKDEAIIRESKIIWTQINKEIPSYYDMFI